MLLGLTAAVSAEAAPPFTLAWGGPGSAAGRFNVPNGVATDADGNVYVTDVFNSRVQVFTNGGVFVRQFRVRPQSYGIAVAPSGNLYVSDARNDVVREYTPAGALVNTFGSSTLRTPVGVAVDADGNVYVASSAGDEIDEFAGDGTPLRSIGSSGTGPGKFLTPYDVAIGPDRSVWVTDYFTDRVLGFRSDGSFIDELRGFGANTISRPWGIEVASSANLYVGNFVLSRVDELRPNGTLVATLASRGRGNGQVRQPGFMTTDCHGNVFVADRSNNRMLKFGNAGAGSPCPGREPQPAPEPQPQPEPGPLLSPRPRIFATGVPRRCVRVGFRLRVRVLGGALPPSKTVVLLRGDRLRASLARDFQVAVDAFSLRPGFHRLRVVNGIGSTGASRTVTFRRCRFAIPRPPRGRG